MVNVKQRGRKRASQLDNRQVYEIFLMRIMNQTGIWAGHFMLNTDNIWTIRRTVATNKLQNSGQTEGQEGQRDLKLQGTYKRVERLKFVLNTTVTKTKSPLFANGGCGVLTVSVRTW